MVVGAKVFRQGSLWSLFREDRLLPPGLEEVKAFLDVLGECDQDIRETLRKERGPTGRDDYPTDAMWGLMAVQLFVRRARFSDLRGELRRNADFARLLGFEELLPGRFDLPPKWVVSRFHRKLKEPRYRAMIKMVQERTVGMARQEAPGIGTHTATDTTDIRTHGHPARNVDDPEKAKPATDSEASWSVKTKRRKRADGTEHVETKSTFGYKAALNVDTAVPLVIEAQTVTGSHNDQLLSTPILEGATRILGKGTMDTCAEDKGFDSEENIEDAYERLGVALIVPTRDVPENLEKLPPEDREQALVTPGIIVRDRYTGEIACYAATPGQEKPTRRELKYGGFDAERGSHKFRCPLGACAPTSCPAFETCSAGLSGEQGRQVRVPMETDPRRFAPVYPRSMKWRRLYNGRSAAERVNSYLKDVLRVDEHCLRGKAAIELRVLLGCITLNLRTILALRAQRSRVRAAA